MSKYISLGNWNKKYFAIIFEVISLILYHLLTGFSFSDVYSIRIVSIGKLGDYLAKELVAEKHDVTIIDTKFNNRNNIINNEDLNYICGNGFIY